MEVLDDFDFELFEDFGDRDFVVLDDLVDRDFAVLEDFLPLFPLPSMMANSTVSSVSSSLARARRAGWRPNSSALDATDTDAARRIVDAIRSFIVAGLWHKKNPQAAQALN